MYHRLAVGRVILDLYHLREWIILNWDDSFITVQRKGENHICRFRRCEMLIPGPGDFSGDILCNSSPDWDYIERR